MRVLTEHNMGAVANGGEIQHSFLNYSTTRGWACARPCAEPCGSRILCTQAGFL